MKRIVIALAAVAFATSAFAADGAAQYAAKCKSCHGAAGEGAKMAPTPIAGTDAATVEKAITEGKGKMKPVKGVDDPKAVAEYVAGLKK